MRGWAVAHNDHLFCCLHLLYHRRAFDNIDPHCLGVGIVKVICAWCPKPKLLSGKMSDPEVSHGICNKCQRKMDKEIARLKSKKQGRRTDNGGH